MRILKRASLAAVAALTLGATALVATPAYAATVTVTTADGITYEADNAAVDAGATAVSYDFSSPVVMIPDTVTIDAIDYDVVTVGANSFNGTDAALLPITDVTIGDNVTVIEFAAFNRNSISNLVLGSSVHTIDHVAFNVNALTSVTLPASLDSLGRNAFASNPNLTSVVFTGPAPSQIFEYDRDVAEPWSNTFEVTSGFMISFPEQYSADHIVDGYTAPEWKRYPTQAVGGPEPGAEVSITKTVDASYVRVYDWELEKTGTVGEITVGEDSASAAVDYTVTATPKDYRDDYHVLTGTITVTNETVEPRQVAVADTPAIGIDTTCNFSTSEGAQTDTVTLSGNESVTLNYRCRLDGTPVDGTNTATVSWGDGESASVTEDVAFVERSSSFEDVTIVDDKGNPDAGYVELGPATWNSDRTQSIFNYTVTHENLAIGECTTVTNTAMIAEMERSTAATIEICPETAIVTPDPTEPVTLDPTKPVITSPTPPALAETGADGAGGIISVAILLMLAGSAAVLATRRTRHQNA